MGGKKKTKKCEVCLSSAHVMHECPHVFEECTKGSACKHLCFVDLCTKFCKIISKFHDVSSSSKRERVFERLHIFEDTLESAYAYLDDHEGRKVKSCSSLRKIGKLRKACTKLREMYESESEDRDLSDEELGYIAVICHMQMGIPKEKEMGVQKEVGQKSQEPLDTPNLTLECAHKVIEDNLIIKMRALALCFDVYISQKMHKEEIMKDLHVIHEEILEHDDDIIEGFLHYLDHINDPISVKEDPNGLQNNKEPMEDPTLNVHEEVHIYNHMFDDDMLEFEGIFANQMDEDVCALILYEGVKIPIHTTTICVRHEGAILPIHAWRLDRWRCIYLYMHYDGVFLWLILINSLGGCNFFYIWLFIFIESPMNEGFLWLKQCLEEMELISLFTDLTF